MMHESLFCVRCAGIYCDNGQEGVACPITTRDYFPTHQHMAEELQYLESRQHCPSCRIAVTTAMPDNRSKRCFGQRNEGWKLRKLRLMFTVPIVVLPLAILLTVVYNTTFRHHPEQHPRSIELPVPEQLLQVIDDYSESFELSERDVLHDLQTNFVPPPINFVHTPSKPLVHGGRRKRNVEDKFASLLRSYEGNVSSEEIVWTIAQPSVLSNQPTLTIDRNNSSLNPFMKNLGRKAQKTNTTGKDISGAKQMAVGTGRTSEEISEEDERHDAAIDNKQNSLTHDYSDDERPETNADDDIYTDIDLSQDDFPLDDTVERLPWDQNENGGQIKPQGDEDDGYRLDDDLMDTPSDDSAFHSFWRGQGDKETIRKVQAKIMRDNMDTNIDPCDDFYQYACGNWERRNPIPKDKGGYDTFEKLRESLDNVLRDLLEEPTLIPAYDITRHDATTKAKFLYQSCMDYELLSMRGEKPLMNLLESMGGWPILNPDWDSSNFNWLTLSAELRLYNNDILIAEWVGPDIKNSDEYVIQFDQSSLGLPTRDYFLSPTNTLYLEAYRTYLIKIVSLLGAPKSTAISQAEDMVDFEIELAKITIPTDDRRNVSELYCRMSVGELRRQVPQIDWYQYLSIVLDRTIFIDEPVVVFTISFFQDLVNLISNTPPRTVCNYLMWRFVRHRVNNLDDRFQDAKQDFYYTLFGREQSPPRWKNCVSQVNSNMGMAVGAMFVQKYFDENSKNDTLKMTEGIMESFRELLRHNDWIDPETKELANLKVDAMLLRIGYPDFILDPDKLNERYYDVAIRHDEYFENTLRILKHLTRAEQDRLGSPVNKTLWNTAPAVVNAYYSRNRNQIMFPAGILQPPFYHHYFPRSLNFGGIGVVIGHEITHGFDDKGRLFDLSGNLHRWWHDSSIISFHERAQCLIDQYSNFVVTEVNMLIDGVNTQGENIADNGGIKQAFRAYLDWLEVNDADDETLPGLDATNEQLFFINFAQVWCGSMRPEATRNKLKTAVHSPGRFRVIGTLSNSEDFARVYKCNRGSPMNPTNKCSVW